MDKTDGCRVVMEDSFKVSFSSTGDIVWNKMSSIKIVSTENKLFKWEDTGGDFVLSHILVWNQQEI